ncbi:uncharacterized protein [Rutidosis leptorrhynchoides]|uniref:uncharacterized protein n=1 Tax=Rutidosis leptorrhynchoides TaxID=125765 RepID=UPI003A9989C5
MSPNHRNSKRKIKIPIKFSNTIHSMKSKEITSEASSGTEGEAELQSVEINQKENNSDTRRDEELDINCADQYPPLGKNLKSVSNSTSEHIVADVIESVDTESKVVESKSDEVENKEAMSNSYALDEDGNEIVIFNEVFVDEGASRWSKTAYGYIIGGNMPYGQLQFNLRKMWNKYGIKEITMDQNHICYFTFRNMEGMNEVIEQGPWIVNGKPLYVGKWSPDLNIKKVEPSKLPVWVKLSNVPLEAWSSKGISAISSKLGKPIFIDNTIASMCHKGTGRVGYARIMIEMEAKKGYPDHVDIYYKDKMNVTKGIKKVNVDYDWKPAMCSHCAVFGHNHDVCKVRPGTSAELEVKINKVVTDKEGFVEAKTPEKRWNLNENAMKGLKQSLNKYVVLSNDDEDSNSSKENQGSPSENDILEFTGNAQVAVGANEVYGKDPALLEKLLGMCHKDKQDELRDFIKEEKVSVCAILETHLKPTNIDSACNYVFGRWRWMSNIGLSSNSCRIVIGWNVSKVNVMIVQVARQVILCLVETIDKCSKFYCSFVYGSNNDNERHLLWNDLVIHATISKQQPWLLMGDFNVTKSINEHSAGCSHMSEDMKSFNKCLNDIEVDDMGSTGFFFTWTKSLKNPLCNVLRKLDRIMCNEVFLARYNNGYGIFHPFMISDHTPAVLGIPMGFRKRKRSFRFMNHVAYKDNFLIKIIS